MTKARGNGSGSVTSESCVAEPDKRKNDGAVGREDLGLLLIIPHVNLFSEDPFSLLRPLLPLQ